MFVQEWKTCYRVDFVISLDHQQSERYGAMKNRSKETSKTEKTILIIKGRFRNFESITSGCPDDYPFDIQ